MKTDNASKDLGLKRKRAASCATHFASVRSKVARIGSCMNSRESCCRCDQSCSRKSIITNYVNFVRSGLPRRVMFFSDGEWSDFPANATTLVINAFKGRRSAIEIVMKDKVHLIDLIHMVLINLKNGSQRSIAWIDETEKCFFPKLFVDDGDDLTFSDDTIKVKVEIEINQVDSSVPEDCNKVSSSTASSKVKEMIVVNDVLSFGNFGFGSLHEKLIRLEGGSADYVGVVNAFLTGFGTLISPSDVVEIYRYSATGCAALARLKSFEKQAENTKRHRGDHNLRRGWFGSSREGIFEILRFGFGSAGKTSTGVHLAPEDCSHVSANYSDVDENGVQHMVLCRVIMGRMEQVRLGSKQFHPSSDEFDSGVDDLQDPKHYVIWATHMSTHIHPEFVVSFKLPPSVREHLARSKDNRGNVDVPISKNQQATSVEYPAMDAQQTRNSTPVPGGSKLPTSGWMPFPQMFAAIEKNISPSAMDLLNMYYSAFKARKITREELVKKLRLIAGDKLLMSTLKRLQYNPPLIPKPTEQMQKHDDPPSCRKMVWDLNQSGDGSLARAQPSLIPKTTEQMQKHDDPPSCRKKVQDLNQSGDGSLAGAQTPLIPKITEQMQKHDDPPSYRKKVRDLNQSGDGSLAGAQG